MKPSFRSYILIVAAAFLLMSCTRGGTRPETYYFGDYSEAERLFEKGDYEHAIQKYQAYIDENPEGNLAVIARYYMGRSYMALGKKDEAKPLFERVVKENPEQVWANFSQTQLDEMNASGAADAPEGK